MRLFEVKHYAETNAFLQVYLHDLDYEYLHHDKRPLAIVLPGGGYQFLADREAEPVALAFLHAGYQACVLRYTVRPDDTFPALGCTPLREAAAAVRYAREHAEDWGIDPQKITVCGFSAGGHLAASLGVLWHDESRIPFAGELCRPNAMALSYAVLTAGRRTHGGTFTNLTGHDGRHPDDEQWSLEKLVSEKTCPAFIWHTTEDDCVPVENALMMAEALQREHVPYALHLFTHGGHGMSLGTPEVGRGTLEGRDWFPMLLKWLDSMHLGSIDMTN